MSNFKLLRRSESRGRRGRRGGREMKRARVPPSSWRMANEGEWRMATGDWRLATGGVVVVDGTAKNCEINEMFSYSRFNAGK